MTFGKMKMYYVKQAKASGSGYRLLLKEPETRHWPESGSRASLLSFKRHVEPVKITSAS